MNQQLDKDHDPEMLEVYDFNEGVLGKYAARLAEGVEVVMLDPGLAEIPTDSESQDWVKGECKRMASVII